MSKVNNEIICPFCQSENVSPKKQAGYVVMLSLLLFALPLPIFKKKFHCFDCDKEWDNKTFTSTK